jgi:hypothetical protein
MKNVRALLVLPWVLALGAGCDLEGEDGRWACAYEKSVTDGCDGYGFGPWVRGCQAFWEDDYYIAPKEVCANLTRGGSHCASSCCIDTRFQSVSLTRGECP